MALVFLLVEEECRGASCEGGAAGPRGGDGVVAYYVLLDAAVLGSRKSLSPDPALAFPCRCFAHATRFPSAMSPCVVEFVLSDSVGPSFERDDLLLGERVAVAVVGGGGGACSSTLCGPVGERT